jgi:AraC-like DNA-binding protein
VFCSRSYLYTIVAEEDSQILVARFVNGNITSEGDTYRSIATEVAKVNYRFTAVPINNVLGSVIDSIAFYLEQGANSKAMHHAKIEEMFVVFRYFYPREVYLRMFYSLFNNNMSFRTLVINNAPNAKNVEHLAKICGHSLSHFKLLFSQYFDTTPYVWMQRNRAIEISELLRDPSMPLKSIIKKYGFTSHGHFSLFCRKFLGDTPRALRRRSHLATSPVTLEDVKKNMERQSRQKAATKKAATGEAPRRRGRPRKNEVR